MKKSILIFLQMICMISFMTSCSQSDSIDDLSSDETEAYSTEFLSLCESIDSINATYSFNSANDNEATRIKTGTVVKWGKKVYTFIMDASTSCICGPIGWLVGYVCSCAYEEYLDYVFDQASSSKQSWAKKNINSGLVTACPTYVYKMAKMEKIDSIGYYHNVLLDRIMTSGETYVLDSNDLDYLNLLRDGDKYAKEYGINYTISSKDTLKYVSFVQSTVKTLANCKENNIDLEITHSYINKYYSTLFGANKNIEQAELVQRKLLTILNDMDSDDEIISYADKINKSIVTNNLDEELYRDIKTIVDVTINSMLY